MSERKFEIINGVTCKRLLKVNPAMDEVTSFSIAHKSLESLWISTGMEIAEVRTASRNMVLLDSSMISDNHTTPSYVSNMAECNKKIFVTVNSEDYRDQRSYLYCCERESSKLVVLRSIACNLSMT